MAGLEDTDRLVVAGNAQMAWGSDVAAEMLRRLDIDYIALNPGASFRGFHDSLVNYLGNSHPQLLLCLHEDHVVAIAHGYAKASDRPMAVALHANVGLMHALLGIFNAWCDRAPMLVMGANGPADASARRPWMDWLHSCKDPAALLRDSVKWDDEPRSPAALVESMLRAGIQMRTPPMGPVFICLDVGLQEMPLDKAPEIPDTARFSPAPSPAVTDEVVARAAELLVGARRPLLLYGRSSRSPVAWRQRVRLAELLGARVVTDLKSAAAFPTAHPQHVGGLTLRISNQAIEAAKSADVLLFMDWIDSASFLRAGDGDIHATLISCSLDSYLHSGWSGEHYGLAPADLSVLADPEVFAGQLLTAVEARLRETPTRSGWPSTTPAAVPREPRKADDATIAASDIGRALGVARVGRKLTLARVPIAWQGESYEFGEPLDFLGYDGGGGLSSGPGNTIGAALALRGDGRLVVGILGDGDFMQGASALWTAARYRIPVLFVISNNRSNLTDVGHQELMARQRGRPVENRWIGQAIDGPAIDIAALARAQGVEAIGPVQRFGDLAAALEQGLRSVEAGHPFLVDVVVDAV